MFKFKAQRHVRVRTLAWVGSFGSFLRQYEPKENLKFPSLVRHETTFNKRDEGRRRREQRRFVRNAQHLVPDLRPQDDGYYPMDPNSI